MSCMLKEYRPVGVGTVIEQSGLHMLADTARFSKCDASTTSMSVTSSVLLQADRSPKPKQTDQSPKHMSIVYSAATDEFAER